MQTRKKSAYILLSNHHHNPRVGVMTSSVEQGCDTLTERRLLPTAELTRMRARWFKPNRAEVNDLDKFGQWLIVNRYLSDFSFRMLRAGKADLLRLNQYQLIDHLSSGPFSGAYL